MTSGFVFVDLVFVSNAVDHWHSSRVCRLRCFLVAALDGQHNFFDVCANGRAQAGVMVTAFVSLKGAFLGLLAVCHCKTSENSCGFRDAQICRLTPALSSKINGFHRVFIAFKQGLVYSAPSLIFRVLTVRWPSGLRRTPGKCVYVNSVPRVQIPVSPPCRRFSSAPEA